MDDDAGPDLSGIRAEQSFSYRKVSAAAQVDDSNEEETLSSSFIFNEKGSIHISFTREEVQYFQYVQLTNSNIYIICIQTYIT